MYIISILHVSWSQRSMPTWQSGFVLGLVSLTNRVVCNKYLSLITAYLKALRFFDPNMLKLLTWRPYAFWFKYAQSSHTSQLDDSVTPGNVETWPAAKSTETFKTLAATSLLSLSLPSSHARYHVIRYFLERLPTQLSINRLVSSPFYCTLLGANCTVYPQTTKPS